MKLQKPWTCRVCDAALAPRRGDAKTCSNKCRQAFYRHRKAAVTPKRPQTRNARRRPKSGHKSAQKARKR